MAKIGNEANIQQTAQQCRIAARELITVASDLDEVYADSQKPAFVDPDNPTVDELASRLTSYQVTKRVGTIDVATANTAFTEVKRIFASTDVEPINKAG